MIRLRHGTWLAVCDGGKAMLLENTGDHACPRLEKREVMAQSNPPAHAQGSAPPGRVFSGLGQRAAVNETDFHEQAEETFLRQFAGRIDQQVLEHKVQLILIAPPRALGLLRSYLAEQTRQALAGELARDYVKLPLHEIERLLGVERA